MKGYTTRQKLMAAVLLASVAGFCVSCGPSTGPEYCEAAQNDAVDGNYEAAIKNYRRALMLETDPVQKGKISCEMGLCLYELQQPARAIEALEQGLAMYPDYSTAYGVLGASYYNLDPVTYRDKAIENLRKFIEMEPESRYVVNFQAIIDELEEPPSAARPDPSPSTDRGEIR
ncbi:MAG TPA: hypothetical protein PK636_03625 [bacterium]|nr:hypothetical protein [bacterium]HPQ65457.1 hypothetical protein [bacterium]